ncbi:Rv3235 family protein [Ruicaihuangia caeni]|uniref:Rv3235 family protein n=1 Tax=Ruicaihuangia caeni TaxID=3042517 RepID=UPI00338F7692
MPGAASQSAAATSVAPTRRITVRQSDEDRFGFQRTVTAALPDPEPLVMNLARCVLEILAGARDLEQVARWVTDQVYRHLLKRVVTASRARQAKGIVPTRPAFSLGAPIITHPADGIVEAVVIANGRARARAIAIRLEGLDRRWRATAIHVL